jgi:hypothetical protein
MPTITAVPDSTTGHVLVTTNWGDVGWANAVRVQRVRSDTGETAALRTWVYPLVSCGEYQTLSGGVALFWDNEAPLDVPVTYVADAVTSTCTALAATTVTSLSVTLAGLDGSWLRDPGRPCNDVRIVRCFPELDPVCLPGAGTFLVAFGSEGYAANAGAFVPTNAARPIPVSLPRREQTSQVAVLTRTIADRDAMKQLLAPGSVLLFSTARPYGIDDEYIDVGDVTISRLSPDHTRQFRGLTAPFAVVDRPVTTQQAVCGASYDDLCTDTWNTIAAAGTTWAGLVKAGFTGGGRTWDQVKAGFANWTAVAVKTWDAIRTGA